MKSIKTAPQRIIKILEIEKKVLDRLNGIFAEERNLLLDFDLSTVNSLNRKKMYLIRRAEAIVELREEVFLDISENLTGIRKHISIDSLLVLLKKNADWDNIFVLLQDVEKLSEEIREHAKHNQRLVQHALDTVKGTIKSITSSSRKQKGYNKFGRKDETNVSGTILAGSV